MKCEGTQQPIVIRTSWHRQRAGQVGVLDAVVRLDQLLRQTRPCLRCPPPWASLIWDGGGIDIYPGKINMQQIGAALCAICGTSKVLWPGLTLSRDPPPAVLDLMRPVIRRRSTRLSSSSLPSAMSSGMEMETAGRAWYRGTIRRLSACRHYSAR